MSRARVVLIASWFVAFVVALTVDAPVARWARATGVAHAVETSHWSRWVKVPGDFWFTAAVVGLLMALRRIDGRRAVFVFAAAAFGGLNFALKWAAGRTRPFKLPGPIAAQPRPFDLHPLPRGLVGLFWQPKDLSFPSGHAATAFALAAAVWVVYRPAAWPLLAAAAAVAVERVLENAHYASDVVAAIGLAMLGTWAARTALWRWVTAGRQIGRE